MEAGTNKQCYFETHAEYVAVHAAMQYHTIICLNRDKQIKTPCQCTYASGLVPKPHLNSLPESSLTFSGRDRVACASGHEWSEDSDKSWGACFVGWWSLQFLKLTC